LERPRVLFVDDTPEIIEYCTRILTANHFDIIGTAPDGKVALEMYAELVPDVIVLDISMPKLNGIATAKRLRADGCKAAIVFLSADTDFVMEAIAAGGSAFVAKSLMNSDLLIAIQEALAGRVFISVPPQRSDSK
jgi:DNA-binding NarL/FixJ family response regulator